MIKTILFPSEVFDHRQVDADMKREYDAALDTGLFDVMPFLLSKPFPGDNR